MPNTKAKTPVSTRAFVVIGAPLVAPPLERTKPRLFSSGKRVQLHWRRCRALCQKPLAVARCEGYPAPDRTGAWKVVPALALRLTWLSVGGPLGIRFH